MGGGGVGGYKCGWQASRGAGNCRLGCRGASVVEAPPPIPAASGTSMTTGNLQRLAGLGGFAEIQAPTVPQKNLLCCGILRHAAACFKPLVGVT